MARSSASGRRPAVGLAVGSMPEKAPSRRNSQPRTGQNTSATRTASKPSRFVSNRLSAQSFDHRAEVSDALAQFSGWDEFAALVCNRHVAGTEHNNFRSQGAKMAGLRAKSDRSGAASRQRFEKFSEIMCRCGTKARIYALDVELRIQIRELPGQPSQFLANQIRGPGRVKN